MRRYEDLSEISDGRIYDVNDMAKLGCGGCEGCSSCCHHMEDTILLDPYDVYRLTGDLGRSFEELLCDKLNLRVADGLVLPHLRMSGQDACVFLNAEGWCSIHKSRPGLCRIFPLGRYYENEEDFKYILQVGECYRDHRTKVKISKWIDTPNYEENRKFILNWHKLQKDAQRYIEASPDGMDKTVSMLILRTLFLQPYDFEKEFYSQYYERENQVRRILSLSVEGKNG